MSSDSTEVTDNRMCLHILSEQLHYYENVQQCYWCQYNNIHIYSNETEDNVTYLHWECTMNTYS